MQDTTMPTNCTVVVSVLDKCDEWKNANCMRMTMHIITLTPLDVSKHKLNGAHGNEYAMHFIVANDSLRT